MKKVILAFDAYLSEKSLRFEAVVIGGGALIIMEVVDRKTKDIDCLDPEIPEVIKKASQEFAREKREFLLDDNWLNNGPVSLKRELPEKWQIRLQDLYTGKSIFLKCLGRSDLIKSKLFAYCDRTNPDFQDLLQLKPTPEELDQSIEWVKFRDGNPGWPAHVDKAFIVLKKALKYES
jgi:hypothetical protein